MKIRFQIFILIILSTFKFYSQNIEFKNNGEKSAYEFFKNFYKQKNYEKQKMKIKLSENQIIYKIDGVKFKINFHKNLDEKYVKILLSGLISPFELFQGTEINLSYMEEMEFLNPDEQTKRYRIWTYPKPTNNPLTNTANPYEFYFELKNENSSAKSEISEFLKDAKLTFFQFAGIIL